MNATNISRVNVNSILLFHYIKINSKSLLLIKQDKKENGNPK